MRSSRLGLSAVALTGLAALAGCGGSSSSSGGASSPSAAVRTYLTSVGNGDGGAACGMLAQSLQARALSTAHAQGIKASSCANLFSQIKAHMSPTQRTAFLAAKISNVVQKGNTATVTVTGGSAQPTLVKTAGKWLITGGIGF